MIINRHKSRKSLCESANEDNTKNYETYTNKVYGAMLAYFDYIQAASKDIPTALTIFDDNIKSLSDMVKHNVRIEESC